MKTFTNIFGTRIEHKPFYHTACNVWRVARYENNEFYTSYENVGYNSYEECLIECNK